MLRIQGGRHFNLPNFMAESHVYFCLSEDLSEEEKNLPLHKISVIDEGEQRQVSARLSWINTSFMIPTLQTKLYNSTTRQTAIFLHASFMWETLRIRCK